MALVCAMVILLLIPLIALSLALQAHASELTGRSPPSRNALRRHRQRARKLGIPPEVLPLQARTRPAATYREAKRQVAKWNPVLAVVAIAIWTIILQPWEWF